MTQRRILYNDKSMNPRRRYNNYIGTQHRSTIIHKENANRYERGSHITSWQIDGEKWKS